MFVFLIGMQFITPRLKRKDWEVVVKPELYETSSQEGISFYERNIKHHIQEHQDLYDHILAFFNINEELVSKKIEQAGWKNIKADELIAIRLGLIAAGILFTLLTPFMFEGFTAILLGLSATALAYIYPELKMKEMRNKRRNEIKHNLPDFLELMVALLEVGTPIQDAILQVSESFNDATGEEFRRAAIESKYNGGQWILSLQEMSERVGISEVSDLVSAMALVSEKGTPLAPVLREQVARIRFRHQQDYEEKAAKMGTKMLPIMGFFIFVPMLVLLLGPAFLGM
ncbi:type II secretion system F family protein [Neobacillus sp. YIM B02564]|uniref:Type II secretion system F family protein n=1 Tax=Neobacillus paridis TaxID=2803862 RepID=A0ABS1TQG9_9BACI|nr:type II secretion system F family protein [Neobacillus paridis]MBL4952125.1 type II secretion system F family protein [Neobacillus paridis]